MTESVNTATAATQADKVQTVLDNMKTPRFFDSVEDASVYLAKCQTEISDFAEHQFVMNGIDSDTGDFDPEVYGEGTRVLVHVLKTRGAKTKNALGEDVVSPATVQCIVVSPTPALDAVQADSVGNGWLQKIFDTQIVHVAVAPLRGSDNLAVSSKDMPLQLADFVTARESGSVTETFDKLFRGIGEAIKAKSPAWAKARITKAELRKAFESRPYALAVYPLLEDRGDKPSLFVMAMQLGIREAKADGLDPTIFQTWIDTRDQKAVEDESVTGEEEDFDLDDLSIAKADDAAPAAEEAATESEDDTAEEVEGDGDTEEEGELTE